MDFLESRGVVCPDEEVFLPRPPAGAVDGTKMGAFFIFELLAETQGTRPKRSLSLSLSLEKNLRNLSEQVWSYLHNSVFGCAW